MTTGSTRSAEELGHLRQLADGFWTAVMMLGLYTGVDLRLGPGALVPYVLCGISAPYFLLRGGAWGSTPARWYLVGLPLMALAALPFVPQATGMLGERLKGVVHLTYSLTVCYSFGSYLAAKSRRSLARLFGGVALLIVIGCALEDYTPFRRLSDAFRHAVFDPQYLYADDARDMRIAGMVRPKLFTEEPSYVAIFLLLALYAWYLCTETPRRILSYFVAATGGLLLIRSPVMLLAVPLAIVGEFARSAPGLLGARVGPPRPRRLLVAVALGVLLSAAVGRAVLAGRIEALRTGQDLSTIIRVVAPVLLARLAVEGYPITGVGITSEEVLVSAAAAGYGRVGLERVTIDKIINAAWLVPIYFGVVGGGAVLLLVAKTLRSVGVHPLLPAVAALLVLLQTGGAFVGVRTWFIVLVVALVHARRRSLAGPDAHRLETKSRRW